MWLLGPAGFPEGSREKGISSSSRQNRGSLSIELLPACPWLTAGRRPEWRPRRASMVSGGAAPGERALHACDPSEACASVNLVRRPAEYRQRHDLLYRDTRWCG